MRSDQVLTRKKRYSKFLIFAGLVIFISAGFQSFKPDSGSKNERPNIIFIISDDHAYQSIGAYGNKLARTPNIDQIAKEGALFENMMVANSICGPSRATLLTGKYSHINGYKTNSTKTPFDIKQQIFPRLMQQNGYQTAWIGKWHLETLPEGFDYWQIPPGQGYYYNPDFIGNSKDTTRYEGYITDLITKFSLDWLDDRDKTKPFMMVIGEKATHRNWVPDLQDLGAYDAVEFPYPETFRDNYHTRTAAANQEMSVEKSMKTDHDLKVHVNYQKEEELSRFTPGQEKVFRTYYDGKITREFDSKQLTGDALLKWKFQRYMRDYMSTANSLDRNIGRIMSYLDAHGLTKNTVLIYTSDQGFYTGEHGWFDKRFMYEQSLKTPFVIRYPGVVKPGSVVSKLAINVDWAPTILDLAGIKVPADMQGTSFLQLIDKAARPGPWRNEVYYHYYEYPSPHRVQPHFGARGERYKLIRYYGPTDFWEFFDLKEDPNELVNVFGEKRYAATVESYKLKLKALVKQYKDDEAALILANEKQRKDQ